MDKIKKYRIDHYLDLLPLMERRKAMKELPELLGMTKDNFYRIKRATIQSTRSANSDQLLIIAEYLGVSLDDLVTKVAEHV